jgi:hypothetical protein
VLKKEAAFQSGKTSGTTETTDSVTPQITRSDVPAYRATARASATLSRPRPWIKATDT